MSPSASASSLTFPEHLASLQFNDLVAGFRQHRAPSAADLVRPVARRLIALVIEPVLGAPEGQRREALAARFPQLQKLQVALLHCMGVDDAARPLEPAEVSAALAACRRRLEAGLGAEGVEAWSFGFTRWARGLEALDRLSRYPRERLQRFPRQAVEEELFEVAFGGTCALLVMLGQLALSEREARTLRDIFVAGDRFYALVRAVELELQDEDDVGVDVHDLGEDPLIRALEQDSFADTPSTLLGSGA